MIGSVVGRNAAPGSSTYPLESELFDGLSPEQEIVMLGREGAPLFTMLSMGLGLPKESTRTMKYIIVSEHPRVRNFLITDNGSSMITTATTVLDIEDPTGTITDGNKLVQIGDLLHVPADQDNQSTAEGTVAAGGEIMEVTNVASGGSITVKRNVGSTATSANVATASDVSLEAMLMTAPMGETERSRDAISHADVEDYNYLEKFQVPFEVSDIARGTEQVGGDPFPRKQKSALNDFMERIEGTFLFNERATTTSNGGVNTYHSRGLMPWIAGNTTTYAAYSSSTDMVKGSTPTSRIWKVGTKNNLNIQNWEYFLSRLYDEGSNRKVFFCGAGFYTTFVQNLEGYLTLNMTSETGNRLGLYVQSWMHGYGDGRPLEFMVHHLFKGPYYNDAVVVDLDYVGYKYFPGEDIKEWKGRNGTGIQENDSPTLKHAWQGIVGLNTTYPRAHAAILGMVNDDATKGGPARTTGTLTPSNT